MSETTPRMALSECVAAQSQKSVTINEALIQIDALNDCYLASMALTAPAASPTDGDAYFVAAGATGDWANHTGKIAYCLDGAWTFYDPFKGMRAYNAEDARNYRYTGGGWTEDISDSGIAAGTYKSLTVDAKGRATAGTNPTTLSGYGITDALSASLVSAKFYLGNASGAAAAVSMSGDAAMDAAGAVTVGKIGGYSVTLAGSVAMSGAYSFVGTLVGNTDVTFPTSGVLAALSVAQTWTATQTVQTETGATAPLAVKNSSSVTQVRLADYYAPNLTAGQYATFVFGKNLTANNAALFQFNYAADQSASNSMAIRFAAGSTVFKLDASGNWLPGNDSVSALGASSLRFSQVYAATGTINTSDSSQKTNVRKLTAVEIAAAQEIAENICVLQFIDAVAKKDADTARLHVGCLADSQVAFDAAVSVQAVLTSHGLDPARYGFWCKDLAYQIVTKNYTGANGVCETYEEQTPILNSDGAQKSVYGLRYVELLMFLFAAEVAARSTLEARVAALEAKNSA